MDGKIDRLWDPFYLIFKQNIFSPLMSSLLGLSSYVAKAEFELPILLLSSPEFWDNRLAPPQWASIKFQFAFVAE